MSEIMEESSASIQTKPEKHSGDRECFCFFFGCGGLAILIAIGLAVAWYYGEHMAGVF